MCDLISRKEQVEEVTGTRLVYIEKQATEYRRSYLLFRRAMRSVASYCNSPENKRNQSTRRFPDLNKLT